LLNAPDSSDNHFIHRNPFLKPDRYSNRLVSARLQLVHGRAGDRKAISAGVAEARAEFLARQADTLPLPTDDPEFRARWSISCGSGTPGPKSQRYMNAKPRRRTPSPPRKTRSKTPGPAPTGC